MELTVYEGERQVGTLRCETDGLFYDISCELAEERERIRRVFVGYAWKSEYVGIPDASGRLTARLPKNRLPDGVTFAVASRLPRGEWLPWRGEADGVQLEEGCIRPTDDGIDLLLPPDEAVKLPAWADKMQEETAFGRQWLRLSLLPDGSFPERTTDKGEETDEENPCDNAGDREPCDDVSGDSFGDEGRETDRADL